MIRYCTLAFFIRAMKIRVFCLVLSLLCLFFLWRPDYVHYKALQESKVPAQIDHNIDQIEHNISETVLTNNDRDVYAKPQFAIVACRDESSPSAKKGFQQHLGRITILLKSAAILTGTTLTFNIASNSEAVYEEVVNIVKEWPLQYKNRLVFNPRREIFYPEEFEYINEHYKLCSAAKLFLKDVFHDMDSLIFLDTDMIFMQPPEDLWKEFKNFETRNVIGLIPHLHHYNPPFNDFPVYGFTGINSGVLLLNLTRIRKFPWNDSIRDTLSKYKLKVLKYSDQEIINIMFSRNNEKYVYEVGCEWNYGRWLCFHGRQICSGAASRGVALLHAKGDQPKMKDLIRAWREFDMNSPIQDLVSMMDKYLANPEKRQCGEIENINDILTKGFKRHFNLEE
ncbi:hypothetical protein SK128_013532 [Halocaridina rubra]|uniref:UDP-D-xylose:beta-D-glucoside alpha-1,3-D-xylosyltransferase n=1 Tax=Halocaridina rubra TaxID=373956 RepID=A0AAN8XVB7_HALRR